ncbi:MAG TPA: hypothetical protein VE242_10000 [Chthoniobacterales bacterium]|nr:hypothetical protein [Chthoniobacterales bacterium]
MIAVNIAMDMNAGITVDTGSATGKRKTVTSTQITFQTVTTLIVSGFTMGSTPDTIEVTETDAIGEGTIVTGGGEGDSHRQS